MSTKEKNNEQLILEAAEAVFLEKGYDKAKTTEIAKRAGVTHAMLHYYFRTKENLFDMIFRQKSEMMSKVLLISFEQDLPFLEKVKKGIENHFDAIASNFRLPGFVFREILDNPERREKFLKVVSPKALAVLTKFKDEMDIEVAKGSIRPIEAYDLIMNIMSLNIFVFIISPMAKELLNMNDDDKFKAYLQHRKAMNVELILSHLKV
ncbi:TetR/AcrR family transcriptional regulator [Dysgonomonas sp. 216]|uniref:TetR/AcrR family transcriptional regulator n=1 Tax=Dysgonomonas sp. 216 TaxID=2302934 RepID=UPI0013D0384B|nr:TetR/AcrR family transcriptional regulator [Dysgonomonas sp. 216]NDW18251.1 TetR/AcrR family transcriptional regulator [Dysgonomonas sp. 216]